jgi:hypothetical protein
MQLKQAILQAKTKYGYNNLIFGDPRYWNGVGERRQGRKGKPG